MIAYFQIRARSCQSTRSNFNGKLAWIGISCSTVQLFRETEGEDVYGARVSFNLKCLNVLCSLQLQWEFHFIIIDGNLKVLSSGSIFIIYGMILMK